MNKVLMMHTARSVSGGILLVVLALWIIDIVFAFIGELSFFKTGVYDIKDILSYALLTTPRRIYEMFPTSALIGTMLGLGSLAASSELVAMNAAGISRSKIGLYALLGGTLVMLPVMIQGELIAPQGERMAQSLRLLARSEKIALGRNADIWIKDKDRVIHAYKPVLKSADEGKVLQLTNLSVYEFGSDQQLRYLTSAESAVHTESGWQMSNLSQTTLGEDGVSVKKTAVQRWESFLEPETLEFTVAKPKYLSAVDLNEYIDYLSENGLDSSLYKSALWQRIFFPLTVLAMVFASLPFVFGSLRSGGQGQRMFLGLSLGLGFYILNRTVASVAEIYRLNAMAAALIPTLILMAGVFLVLRRRV